MDWIQSMNDVPQNSEISYANPYTKPSYCLIDFEIDFDEFQVDDDDSNLKEIQQYKEKLRKIQELKKLKEIENQNDKMYNFFFESQGEIQENSEIKKEIQNTNKIISIIENCTADLTRYFFNYHSSKQNQIFNKLNDLIYETDLELTGENENSRSQNIFNELNSLESEFHKTISQK